MERRYFHLMIVWHLLENKQNNRKGIGMTEFEQKQLEVLEKLIKEIGYLTMKLHQIYEQM